MLGVIKYPQHSASSPLHRLGWKLQLLSLQDLRDVEIEEVAVEDGLDAAGDDGDDVIEALRVVSVDPVEDVETAVGTESKEIVAGDRLRLPCLAHHEQLGQDGHALQVDGEGPEDLHHAELVVHHQGQQDARTQQKLYPEGVVITVIGCLNKTYISLIVIAMSWAHLEFQIHQIDSSRRAAYEEDLHDGVVERDKAGEEVQVPGHEHHQEQDLRFPGYSGTTSGLPDLQQEQHYC